MAALDKYLICEKLKEQGWTEVAANQLTPPDSLWTSKPHSFYVYDAEQLQDLLAPTQADDTATEK